MRRTCAYCGGNRTDRTCKCRYRRKRKRIDGLNGGFSVEVSNLSAQTTLAEMLENIQEALPISIQNPKKTIGVWRWSFDMAASIKKKDENEEPQ